MLRSLFDLTLHRLVWIPAVISLAVLSNSGPQSGVQLADAFARQVDRRLAVPVPEQRAYPDMLAAALSDAGMKDVQHS